MMRSAMLMGVVLIAAASAAGFDVVRDGRPAATIVIPDQASDLERWAAGMLAQRLREGCGQEFAIHTESNRPAGPAIAVGRTTLARDLLSDLERRRGDAYHLRVQGQTLLAVGRDDDRFLTENDGPRPLLDAQGHLRFNLQGAMGSVRACIAVLEQLGYRWLQPSSQGTFVPRLVNASIADDLDLRVEPWIEYSFGYRVAWPAKYPEHQIANNHRMAVRFYTRGGHTWFDFVPPSLFATEPELFRLKSGRREMPDPNHPMLCPSNPRVQQRLADAIRARFDLGYDLVELAHSDGYAPCECDNCRQLDKPGEHHEQVHHAHWRVLEMVGQTHPDKRVNLLIYGPTLTPSAHIERYPANTVLQLCKYDLEALQAWGARAPGGLTAYVYYMGTWQDTGLAVKFTPRQAMEELRRFHQNGVRGIYWCNGGENWGGEGPTYYAIGRLMTDPTLDWNALLVEYCQLTFGPAAAAMEEFYRLMYHRIEQNPLAADGRSAFVARYPPRVIEQLRQHLAAARLHAAGHERALGWIRSAELAFEHTALIACVYHTYAAYELNRNMENLRQVGQAVDRFNAFCAELAGEISGKWGDDYFPARQWWANARTNEHRLGSPFSWDFATLIAGGYLPGASTRRDVAARVQSPPVIDGRVEDAAWTQLGWRPVGGIFLGASDADTHVSFGFDDERLYLAFRCHEPRWEGFAVRPTSRDSAAVYNQECVEIFLSPRGDGRFMHLILGPADGAVHDGRKGYIDDPLHPLALSGAEDLDWNPRFEHAWHIDASTRAWTMEVAIPFKELSVATPRPGERWRVNFGRERYTLGKVPDATRQDVELFLWSPNLERGSFTDPGVFGELHFERLP
jgi:hypothetical protein